MDAIDLIRLLTQLAMPFSVLIWVIILSLILTRRHPRLSVSLVAAGLLIVAPLATPWVARALIGSLEASNPPRNPHHCVQAEAIVVLGGAIRPRLIGDPFIRLHQGSDRIAVAARLYKAGCAGRILVAAGGAPSSPLLESEAEAARDLLISFGVPDSVIDLDMISRNTRQNAEQAKISLMGMRRKRILLVTSSWHLPRSIIEFESVGFKVTPVGADYRGFASAESSMLDLIPNPEALALSQLAIKEYLGLAILTLR